MSDNWTDHPKLLRNRRLQEEAFAKAEREAEEAMKKFYRENSQKLARAVLADREGGAATSRSPLLDKIYSSSDGGTFGGLVGPEDE